ncbi:MAG TPA: hypothetical protein VNW97_01395 [Candidatus Saccharimonadales bacterium]|nr:hypothetical protein [Candidatus Saccharimonadales bacterium]
MDYRLLYSQKALSDLAEIIGHIADAEAASRFGGALLNHVHLLTSLCLLTGAFRVVVFPRIAPPRNPA